MKYISVIFSLAISISISATVVLWDVQFAAEFGVNENLATAMFIQMEAIYIFFPYIRAMSYVTIDKKRSKIFHLLRKIFKNSPVVDLFEEVVSRIIGFFKWFASDKALLIYVFVCIVTPASLQVSKKFVNQRANLASAVSDKPEKPDEKLIVKLNKLIDENKNEITNLQLVDEKLRNYYQINKLNKEIDGYKEQRKTQFQSIIDYPGKLTAYNDKVASKQTTIEKDEVTWFFDYVTIFFTFICVIILQYGSYKTTQRGAYNLGVIAAELKEWYKRKKEKQIEFKEKNLESGVNEILDELSDIEKRSKKREKFIESLDNENIVSDYTDELDTDSNEKAFQAIVPDQSEPIQFEKIVPPPDTTFDDIRERANRDK